MGCSVGTLILRKFCHEKLYLTVLVSGAWNPHWCHCTNKN